ncbi:hypothetical protein, partial [Neptunitalea chrysea]|uniref:hypothetical protein n=1 Tax=Neptunitalea chrysea TaxID=1647581 RepID=UPI00249317CF
MSEKASQTLYRFRTFRSPELFSEEGKEERFIMQPESEKVGAFYNNMNNRQEGESKMEVLKNAATVFQPNTNTVDSLKETFPKLIPFGRWLTRNKANYKDDILSKISEVYPRTSTILWNELFYQIITQENFYVKEVVIEALLANHVVSAYRQFKSDGVQLQEIPDALEPYVNAKVLLPAELFDFSNEATVVSSNATSSSVKKIDNNWTKAQNVSIAN